MFCISCPAKCRLQLVSVPQSAARDGCLEHLYANGRCDAACNSAECGFDGGDCTVGEMAATCLAEQEFVGDFSGHLDVSSAVALNFTLVPRSLTTTKDGGPTVFVFDVIRARLDYLRTQSHSSRLP